jgi:hydrogenase 3 maturation protease
LGEHPEVLVIDAGPSPENFTGLLRHFQPNLVILIDAADMGDPPGTVHWIEWDDVDGMSASTHRLPPGTLASFLMTELGCRAALLGIQVGDVGIDQPMTPAVNAAVEQLVIEWTGLVSRH